MSYSIVDVYAEIRLVALHVSAFNLAFQDGGSALN
jgi:hypothetical protein